MPLKLAISDALHAQSDLTALACVDLQSGAILTASTRGPGAEQALGLAAMVAADLCSAPVLDGAGELGGAEPGLVPAREALVVSDASVHAFARSARRPDWAVVAIAHGRTNVALLLASVRALAETIGAEA